MTPDVLARQIRSARAWLDWSREDLATRAGVAPNTLAALEKGDAASEPNARTMGKILGTITQAGLELTDDGGVKPRLSRVSYFTGAEGFHRFFDDIYETVSTHPHPDVCIANNDDALIQKFLGDYEVIHIDRMSKLGLPKYKVLVKESDTYIRSSQYCDFRWVANSQFADTCVYIYGDKTAFIDFAANTVTVTLVDSQNVSSALRRMFEVTWNSAKSVGAA